LTPARPRGFPPRLLAAIAVGAAAFYQLILLLPLAFGLGLAALWYRNAFLMGVALLAFVLLAWLVQPRTVLRVRLLGRDEAPELYRRVDALADALDAPRLHGIALDDELNAGALELNRGMSLRRTRRVLILGRPLLGLLDVPALEAVVAHELGHFSRQHGRLGHWLYRTRQAWAGLLAEMDRADSSPWDRSARAFAQRFVPWFSRLSHAHMRRCEFEADATAARAGSAQALARALLMLERADGSEARSSTGRQTLLMRHHAEPPQDLLQRQLDVLRRAQGPVFDGDEIAGEDDDESSTHPPTAQRLAALGVAAQALDIAWPAPADCAGAQLLGTHWPGLAAELAALQDPASRLFWQLGHRLLTQLAQAQVEDAVESLRQAWFLAEYRQATERGEAMLQQQPQAVELSYLLAGSLLAQGEQEVRAKALLLHCRDTRLPWRDAATLSLAEHGESLRLSAAELKTNTGRLSLVRRRRQQVAQQMAAAVERGEFGAAPLPVYRQQALAEALRHHPVVREAWLVGLDGRSDKGVDYQGVALLLRLDPARMAELHLDDDQITAQVLGLLALCLTPELLRLSRPSYTTEGLPPLLAQRLDTLAQARLV